LRFAVAPSRPSWSGGASGAGGRGRGSGSESWRASECLQLARQRAADGGKSVVGVFVFAHPKLKPRAEIHSAAA